MRIRWRTRRKPRSVDGLADAHDLALYCYGAVEGIPAGIEIRDAGELLPESAVFRHRSGSYAFFSDWFRYELLLRGAGTWIDTDVYLLGPLDPKPRHYFGEQAPGVLNNAVLRLPAESPLLADLLAPFEGKTPKWLRGRDYMTAGIRKWLSGSADPALLRWGTTGPHDVLRRRQLFARRHTVQGGSGLDGRQP